MSRPNRASVRRRAGIRLPKLTPAAFRAGRRVRTQWPLGHYYSPVPDDRELRAEPRRSQVWPALPPETPGLEWRDEGQVRLCLEIFAAQERLEWPDSQPPGAAQTYVNHNPMFPPLDAWLLEAMLRWLKPRRLIEVGVGFSSLVTARVNREVLGDTLEFVCIDPHPPAFLNLGIAGVGETVEEAVQDVDLGRFERLERNDILFIDTSHTVKTGGDVHWLYNRILPILKPGVAVHLHDIFLPRDYPEDWVSDGWGWNEQYLAQSFLAFNYAFEILAGARYLAEHHPDALEQAFPAYATYAERGGSSLWIRRVEAAP